MSPIAPRYRGPNPSSDDSQPALSPILTIPHLTPIEDDPVTYSQVVSDSAPSEQADVEAAGSKPGEAEPTPPIDNGTQPVRGSMQESIQRITNSATRSLKSFGTNKSFNPIETVRGVLPGIVISISIICLWWIVGRSSPAPQRQDIARETQTGQEMINPIADDPLRATEQVADARNGDSASTSAEANRDEQLFDHVPFINRPTNDSVSQSDSTPEAPTTVPPAEDGPQADARPAPSQSSFPPEAQTDIASNRPNPAPTGRDVRADVLRPNVPGREPVGAAERSTEFEWPRDRQVASQPTDRSGQRRDDRQPQRPYSYQQTDPSTYQDPIYHVPPVARRARSAQR